MSDVQPQGLSIGQMTSAVVPWSERVRVLFIKYAWICVAACIVASIMCPLLAPLFFVTAFILSFRFIFSKEEWPLCVPETEFVYRPVARTLYRILGLTTPPGKAFRKALRMPDAFKRGDGILLLGWERKRPELTMPQGVQEPLGRAIWVNREMICAHMLMFATTGGGKTEALIGLIQQVLAWGSGSLLVDGKADIKTWFMLYTVMRQVDAVDNLLVVNFLTAGESSSDAVQRKRTNRMNPFAVGSSDNIMEMISALMGAASGNDGMWRGRAEALGRALTRALVEKRDKGSIYLDVSIYREYLNLLKLEELIDDPDLSELAQKGIKSYLMELPGWHIAYTSKLGPETQARQQVNLQFGYQTMYFSQVFELLSATYRHIMVTDVSEIDWADVITNRRTVYVMLPAVEKSPESLKSLGRVVVTSIKNAVVPLLGGANLTGARRAMLEARSTNTKYPYLMVFDEYGSYAVEGFGDVVAQVRSMGIGVVFAGQDYDGFKRGSEIEAQRILGNTGLWLFGATTSPETANIAIKKADEHYVTVSRQAKKNTGLLGGHTVNDAEASVERISRINIQDLARQVYGQFHILYKDKVLRARTFYGDYKLVDEVQINHMIKIRRHTADATRIIKELMGMGGLDKIEAAIQHILTDDSPLGGLVTPIAEDVERVLRIMPAWQKTNPDPLLYGPTALISLKDIKDIGGSAKAALDIHSVSLQGGANSVLMDSLWQEGFEDDAEEDLTGPYNGQVEQERRHTASSLLAAGVKTTQLARAGALPREASEEVMRGGMRQMEAQAEQAAGGPGEWPPPDPLPNPSTAERTSDLMDHLIKRYTGEGGVNDHGMNEVRLPESAEEDEASLAEKAAQLVQQTARVNDYSDDPNQATDETSAA